MGLDGNLTQENTNQIFNMLQCFNAGNDNDCHTQRTTPLLSALISSDTTMATNYMYCVTVDLSAINYTKGKMSYLNVNEKFICFKSVYVLGRCGLNLSQFANDSSAVLLACSGFLLDLIAPALDSGQHNSKIVT